MELIIYDRIRNRKITFFNRVKIELKYNSIASTFELDYYFDPNNQEHKDLSCVGHYHICRIYHEGQLILTGYVLSISFSSGPVRNLVSIGGYSLPGVLEDCEIPVAIDGIGLDNHNLSLKEIAIKYLKPFGLGLIIDGVAVVQAEQKFTTQEPVNSNQEAYDPDAQVAYIEQKLQTPTPQIDNTNANNTPEGVKDKYGVTITPWGNDEETVADKMDNFFLTASALIGQNIKSYLAQMASYKNIILTHDEYGNLVFTKAKHWVKPIAIYKDTTPALDMKLYFDGQSMHSHIMARQQSDAETGKYTQYQAAIRNPYVPYVFRPKVIAVTPPDGASDYTLTSAKNQLATELRGIKLTITLNSWFFPNGKLLKPNNIIVVVNPEIYLYKESKWFIESVMLEGTQENQSAKLTCVLPSVYDHSQPYYYFTGINTH